MCNCIKKQRKKWEIIDKFSESCVEIHIIEYSNNNEEIAKVIIKNPTATKISVVNEVILYVNRTDKFNRSILDDEEFYNNSNISWLEKAEETINIEPQCKCQTPWNKHDNSCKWMQWKNGKG